MALAVASIGTVSSRWPGSTLSGFQVDACLASHKIHLLLPGGVRAAVCASTLTATKGGGISS